jgi:hypothetical protein
MDSVSNPAAASRKRARGPDSQPELASNVVDLSGDDPEPSGGLRRQIELLLESLPPDWNIIAARYGVEPHVDEVLCALGKAVAATLRSVEESAEEARLMMSLMSPPGMSLMSLPTLPPGMCTPTQECPLLVECLSSAGTGLHWWQRGS